MIESLFAGSWTVSYCIRLGQCASSLALLIQLRQDTSDVVYIQQGLRKEKKKKKNDKLSLRKMQIYKEKSRKVSLFIHEFIILRMKWRCVMHRFTKMSTPEYAARAQYLMEWASDRPMRGPGDQLCEIGRQLSAHQDPREGDTYKRFQRNFWNSFQLWAPHAGRRKACWNYQLFGHM